VNAVRIFNLARKQWWLPGALGHTPKIEQAGLFEISDAIDHSRDTLPLNLPNNVIVPLSWRELEEMERATC
jgi:hypothetical protein